MATSLAETLQQLQMANGLSMAAVVSADGLVVESAAEADVDAESICSVAANGLLMMDALGQELGGALADLTTMEFPNQILMMAPLDEDNLLILLAGAGVNLGRMRITLKRHVDQLAGQLP